MRLEPVAPPRKLPMQPRPTLVARQPTMAQLRQLPAMRLRDLGGADYATCGGGDWRRDHAAAAGGTDDATTPRQRPGLAAAAGM